MQQLLEGVHRFREDEFGRYKAMFKRLSRQGQKPHTLFITCADSRVLAELRIYDADMELLESKAYATPGRATSNIAISRRFMAMLLSHLGFVRHRPS